MRSFFPKPRLKQLLKDELGENFQIITIGQAGRTGIGIVPGSKNIKAAAVIGTGPLPVFDVENAYANYVCDALGLDTISAGVVAAWAIACFEKGLVSRRDTGRDRAFSDSASITAVPGCRGTTWPAPLPDGKQLGRPCCACPNASGTGPGLLTCAKSTASAGTGIIRTRA